MADMADKAYMADMVDMANKVDRADRADRADMANLKLSPHSLTHSLSDIPNYKEMLSHLKKFKKK